MWAVAVVPITHQVKFKLSMKKHCTRVYIPLLKVKKKVKHKNQPIEEYRPAFGSYIFVKIRKGHVSQVIHADHCKGLIMSSGEVAKVSPKAIKQIKALEAMNFEPPPAPVREVKVGDVVKVNMDAFDGNFGRVLHLLKKGTVEIALGNVSFIVAVDKIQPI